MALDFEMKVTYTMSMSFSDEEIESMIDTILTLIPSSLAIEGINSHGYQKDNKWVPGWTIEKNDDGYWVFTVLEQDREIELMNQFYGFKEGQVITLDRTYIKTKLPEIFDHGQVRHCFQWTYYPRDVLLEGIERGGGYVDVDSCVNDWFTEFLIFGNKIFG